MKRFINITAIGCCITAMGLMTACSDFSDYNEAPVDAQPSGNLTLWENIQQHPQLTEFASLLRRTGFAEQLANSRTYTVWAPVNGTFSVADYQHLGDSLVLQQFVKSHVAQYVHVASGDISERIHTLNGKSFDFLGNGNYTYAGQKINQANLPSSNGVVHLLDGMAHFYPNLYEYLRMGENIDSLRNYFLKYELTTLDIEQSVKGPMVEGVQTYIDSVVVTDNQLINRLNADLANEDSTYTFLMPTNKAYADLYAKIKPLYNILATTTVQDVDAFAKPSDTMTKEIQVDKEYLSDSLVRSVIVGDLVYSNNNVYNRWLVDKGEFTDTLRSTTRSKFSNPRDILAPVIQKQSMSNGSAYIMDSLAFLPWELYNPQIEANLANNVYRENSKDRFTFSSNMVNVPDSIAKRIFNDPLATRFRYLWIYPTSDYAKPDVFVELPNVLSTTYQIYAVFMPTRYQLDEDRYWIFDSGDEKPNLLNFQLNYCGANGKVATYSFSSKYLASGDSKDENPKAVNKTTAFTNDPYKVDTVYLGQFTFPVAYRGLNGYSPNIHISNPIGVFNKTDMATYTRDVRLAAIILKPMELVEYEENEKTRK
ncbi:MAG: fasciclin domain-containing protein [Prevotella sp.]|nr:fasciclin domain-containing protein [Prevotella sp.]